MLLAKFNGTEPQQLISKPEQCQAISVSVLDEIRALGGPLCRCDQTACAGTDLAGPRGHAAACSRWINLLTTEVSACRADDSKIAGRIALCRQERSCAGFWPITKDIWWIATLLLERNSISNGS